MKIKKGIISVKVSNVDSALKFYSELLGFRVLSKYGSGFGEVQGPGLTIGVLLSPPRESSNAGTQNLSIGLEVDDIDLAVTELKSKGVVLLGNVIEDSRARFANFYADGNFLHLSQAKKGIWT